MPQDLVPPPPFEIDGIGIKTADDITEENYVSVASQFKAGGVVAPPPLDTTVSVTFDQGSIGVGTSVSKSNKELIIPAGYSCKNVEARVAAIYYPSGPDGGHYPTLGLQVGDRRSKLQDSLQSLAMYPGPTANLDTDFDTEFRGAVPVSLTGYDLLSYIVNVTAKCNRESSAYEAWQLDTYTKIYAAYKAMKTEYDQKVAQLQAQRGAIIIEGRNPTTNREIEKNELKKFCIMLFTGQYLEYFRAMTSGGAASFNLPEIDIIEALNQGPEIQFFEQAFDWDQLTYLFYPYFWGRKANWAADSLRTDPDPLFAQFLQAGSARVVVPVSKHYDDAVRFFLQTPGNIADRSGRGANRQPSTTHFIEADRGRIKAQDR